MRQVYLNDMEKIIMIHDESRKKKKKQEYRREIPVVKSSGLRDSDLGFSHSPCDLERVLQPHTFLRKVA